MKEKDKKALHDQIVKKSNRILKSGVRNAVPSNLPGGLT